LSANRRRFPAAKDSASGFSFLETQISCIFIMAVLQSEKRFYRLHKPLLTARIHFPATDILNNKGKIK
jgi:hypothetical protein